MTSKISSYIVAVLIFLLPIFFLPFLPIPMTFAKTSIAVVLSIAAFLTILVDFLKNGRIEIAKSYTLAALGAVVLSYLASTIFSGSVGASLFGYGYELDTFLTITALSLLLVSASVSFKNQNNIFYSYLAYLSAFVLLCVYQAIRIFGPADFLSFNVFFGKTANLVGKWSDVGVLAGLSLVISLATLEFLKLARPFRIFLYVTSTLSLVFMALVNLKAVWIMAAVVSLLFFIYSLSKNYKKSEETERQISKPSLIVLLVSFIFIISGSDLNNTITGTLGITSVEARPSWQSTYVVAKESVYRDPLLGVGPNRFSQAWLSSKPLSVNASQFWNTDFNFGVGFIPSLIVTTGIIGAIAWLAFLIAIFFEGFKSLFKREHDGTWDFFIFSSLMSSFYLWGMSIVYPPNIVVLTLAFVSTGTLVAAIRASGGVSTKTINFSQSSRMSFISVFALVILAIVTLTGAYVSVENTIAQYKYQKGVIASATDIAEAERLITQAVSISKKDLYLRELVKVQLAKIDILARQEGLSPDVAQSEFQNILGAAVNYGKTAIEADPTNYLNWLSLGSVYESLVPFKVEGSYDEALKVYNEALTRNPKNPAINLFIARLEATAGNNEAAKQNISKSLAIKNNYTDAIFLLSQIEVAEGNVKEAIKSVEAAGLIAPNDPVVFFQLGLLRYTDKNFEGAVGAFERAVILNPYYSNAKYFLGLSYYELGRRDDAVAQFEDIVYLNPENPEAKLILSNLKEGKAPLVNATAPLDQAPEEREELPIAEEE